MPASKKQLFPVHAVLVLLLFTSCYTSKYTYYYSVLKLNNKKVENNFEKTRDRHSEYSIHNLLSDTADYYMGCLVLFTKAG